jgi:hypothetical protein
MRAHALAPGSGALVIASPVAFALASSVSPSPLLHYYEYLHMRNHAKRARIEPQTDAQTHPPRATDDDALAAAPVQTRPFLVEAATASDALGGRVAGPSVADLRAAARQSRWMACDACGKWRRLPPRRGRLPVNWVCADNLDRAYSRCGGARARAFVCARASSPRHARAARARHACSTAARETHPRNPPVCARSCEVLEEVLEGSGEFDLGAGSDDDDDDAAAGAPGWPARAVPFAQLMPPPPPREPFRPPSAEAVAYGAFAQGAQPQSQQNGHKQNGHKQNARTPPGRGRARGRGSRGGRPQPSEPYRPPLVSVPPRAEPFSQGALVQGAQPQSQPRARTPPGRGRARGRGSRGGRPEPSEPYRPPLDAPLAQGAFAQAAFAQGAQPVDLRAQATPGRGRARGRGARGGRGSRGGGRGRGRLEISPMSQSDLAALYRSSAVGIARIGAPRSLSVETPRWWLLNTVAEGLRRRLRAAVPSDDDADERAVDLFRHDDDEGSGYESDDLSDSAYLRRHANMHDIFMPTHLAMPEQRAPDHPMQVRRGPRSRAARDASAPRATLSDDALRSTRARATHGQMLAAVSAADSAPRRVALVGGCTRNPACIRMARHVGRCKLARPPATEPAATLPQRE